MPHDPYSGQATSAIFDEDLLESLLSAAATHASRSADSLFGAVELLQANGKDYADWLPLMDLLNQLHDAIGDLKADDGFPGDGSMPDEIGVLIDGLVSAYPVYALRKVREAA